MRNVEAEEDGHEAITSNVNERQNTVTENTY